MCIEVCDGVSDARCLDDVAENSAEETAKAKYRVRVILALVLLFASIATLGFASSSNAFAAAENPCVDTPPLNDGWGWDGTQSCRTGPAVAGDCVDSEPFDDDWGWNGVAPCRLSELVGAPNVGADNGLDSDIATDELSPEVVASVEPLYGLVHRDPDDPNRGFTEIPDGFTGTISALGGDEVTTTITEVDDTITMTISADGEEDTTVEMNTVTGDVKATTETADGRTREVTGTINAQGVLSVTVTEDGKVVDQQEIDLRDEDPPFPEYEIPFAPQNLGDSGEGGMSTAEQAANEYSNGDPNGEYGGLGGADDGNGGGGHNGGADGGGYAESTGYW